MAKQERLEGVAPQIPSIEAAALRYVEVRDERMSLTEKEVEAHEVLLAAMKQAHVEHYRTMEGLECTLSTKEKVKVSRKDEE